MGASERRLEIMKYLCRERHATMPALAEKYGVSVRTIQRDIDIISGEMGIPVYVKSGKYDGGVYVLGEYTMDRMYMSTEQLNVLSKMAQICGNMLSEHERSIFFEIIKSYTKPGVNVTA